MKILLKGGSRADKRQQAEELRRSQERVTVIESGAFAVLYNNVGFILLVLFLAFFPLRGFEAA